MIGCVWRPRISFGATLRNLPQNHTWVCLHRHADQVTRARGRHDDRTERTMTDTDGGRELGYENLPVGRRRAKYGPFIDEASASDQFGRIASTTFMADLVILGWPSEDPPFRSRSIEKGQDPKSPWPRKQDKALPTAPSDDGQGPPSAIRRTPTFVKSVFEHPRRIASTRRTSFPVIGPKISCSNAISPSRARSP